MVNASFDSYKLGNIFLLLRYIKTKHKEKKLTLFIYLSLNCLSILISSIGFIYFLLGKTVRFCLIFVISIVALNTVYASPFVLSAITSKTIQGNAPLIVTKGTTIEASLDDIVSVVMPDGTILSPSGSQNYTYSGITTDKLKDIINNITYFDNDEDMANGDYQVLDEKGISGISYSWKDKNNREITNLSEILSSCLSPYTLTVTANNAQAIATYGDPLSKAYGSLNQNYTIIIPKEGENGCIEYLQPSSMDVYDSSYNVSTFDPSNGFKTSSGFPKTGFYKAKFSLIGSTDNQINYRCTSSDDGGKIILSGNASTTLGQNCTVTYNVESKKAFMNGNKTPTIYLEYNSGGEWGIVDSYTIPEPNKWPIGGEIKRFGNAQNLNLSSRYPALDYCQTIRDGNQNPITVKEQVIDTSGSAWRQQYLYRKNELTNSPSANFPEYSSAFPSTTVKSKRDVDGTILGEWGDVYRGYPGSIWEKSEYTMTAELANTMLVFFVYSNGRLAYENVNSDYLGAVCRGE